MRANAHGGGPHSNLFRTLLQAGDGDSWLSAVERQPMQLIGDGYVQQLGIEMTADLQRQRDGAKTAAASSQTAQTVNLFGTADQKQRWLAPTREGQLGTFSTSFFTTRVTMARKVSSEATAKAPTKSYSL